MVAAGTVRNLTPNEKERPDWAALFLDQPTDALLAGMPQAIIAEISPARWIVGTIPLRTVRCVAANSDGHLIDRSRLTERDKR